jgi:addiction module RelB/DinJ family antitoxin
MIVQHLAKGDIVSHCVILQHKDIFEGRAVATQALNLRLDAEEKQRFVDITARLGLSPSDAVRVFVHRFNHDGGFPFDVREPYPPMSTTERNELTQIKAALKDGTAKTYDSWAELKADILADGEL